MTAPVARPRLSRKVRLRFDRRSGRYLLLYPETGLELNRTATEIARLCTGAWTTDDIAQRLARIYADVPPDDIKRDVLAFLRTLARRGLLHGLP
jgi:coenzyme PQQ biosynthesis protein PqqD